MFFSYKIPTYVHGIKSTYIHIHLSEASIVQKKQIDDNNFVKITLRFFT